MESSRNFGKRKGKSSKPTRTNSKTCIGKCLGKRERLPEQIASNFFTSYLRMCGNKKPYIEKKEKQYVFDKIIKSKKLLFKIEDIFHI